MRYEGIFWNLLSVCQLENLCDEEYNTCEYFLIIVTYPRQAYPDPHQREDGFFTKIIYTDILNRNFYLLRDIQLFVKELVAGRERSYVESELEVISY